MKIVSRYCVALSLFARNERRRTRVSVPTQKCERLKTDAFAASWHRGLGVVVVVVSLRRRRLASAGCCFVTRSFGLCSEVFFIFASKGNEKSEENSQWKQQADVDFFLVTSLVVVVVVVCVPPTAFASRQTSNNTVLLSGYFPASPRKIEILNGYQSSLWIVCSQSIVATTRNYTNAQLFNAESRRDWSATCFLQSLNLFNSLLAGRNVQRDETRMDVCSLGGEKRCLSFD